MHAAVVPQTDELTIVFLENVRQFGDLLHRKVSKMAFF